MINLKDEQIIDINTIKKIYNTNNKKYKFDEKNIVDNSFKKINVIIGVKGRINYLKTTIKYFNSAIKYAEMENDIMISVCEHDTSPNLKSFCIDNKINYGFIDLTNSDTDNLYSRSLAYNTSVKCFPNSEWVLLHDSDLLVTYDFFSNLKPLMENNKTWIQPYSNKMVLNISKEHTELLQTSEKLFDLNKDILPNVILNLPGAVGGSLLIKTKLFYEVGGFDNEIFWGYAPEDALFWFKLECLFQKIENHNSWYCHLGSADYAQNNNMFHQYHEHEITKNKFFYEMDFIKKIYMNLNYESIMELIKLKKDLFNKH